MDDSVVIAGLSPRGRGKPDDFRSAGEQDRSIPAWAGETPPTPAAWRTIGVYPRVGGGNLYPDAPAVGTDGLSPRGRGKPQVRIVEQGLTRSIPAWAGETRVIGGDRWQAGVYPRVGGGNGSIQGVYALVGGLSPRGRGKLIIKAGHISRERSIPAWAGETGLHRRRNEP